MYPYKFVKTMLAGCLGTCVYGYGLAKPQTNPLNDGFARAGYMVRGGLNPTAPGYNKTTQQFAAVDLVGSGLAVQGQFGLQALSRLSNPNG